LRISEFLRRNLWDLQFIQWRDGTRGYNPRNLIIDRFGLNFDFIQENNLTWIENLITGSGKNLASPNHPNHNMEYVQDYLQNVGERKCEANALVPIPHQARALCRNAIEHYLGADALGRFEEKRQEIRDELINFREETGLDDVVENALERIAETENDGD
jgi:hypothetical protein